MPTNLNDMVMKLSRALVDSGPVGYHQMAFRRLDRTWTPTPKR